MIVLKDSTYDILDSQLAKDIVTRLRRISDNDPKYFSYFSTPRVLSYKKSKSMGKCVIFINHFNCSATNKDQKSCIYEIYYVNNTIRSFVRIEEIFDVCLKYNYKKLTANAS